MRKLRRDNEQVEQLKFPEPREGVPEDPRPFIGSAQLRMGGALLEHLSSHGLVAVAGPLGSGKSTVVARAANSRWARQWFLQDEGGHPVHRRFWADLEECRPGAETEERIARAVGRATFSDAMGRLSTGKPCLLILDNAGAAFHDEPADNPVLHQLAWCVDRGATVVVAVRNLAGVWVDRPWTATIETSVFATEEDAKQLFDQMATEYAKHWLAPELVARCQRLPLAVSLLAKLTIRYSVEQIAALTPLGEHRRQSDPDGGGGLRFVLDLASSLLSPEERRIWAGLTLFPAGLSGGDNLTGVGDEISAVFGEIPDARNRTIRLHDLGLAQRSNAGVRIPGPLHPNRTTVGLDPGTIARFWAHYVQRGRQAVTSEDVDRWLTRQQANLNRLGACSPPPDGALDLACAALLARHGGHAHDSLDTTLVRIGRAGVGNSSPTLLAATAKSLLEQGRAGAAILVAALNVDTQRGGPDRGAHADAAGLLGRAESIASRYHDAARHLNAALTDYQELGNVLGQATTHLEIGQVELARGRLDDAERQLTRALACFGEIGLAQGQANTRLELVRVDLARGNHDAAQLHLGDALKSFEEAADRVGQANALLQLGQVDLAASRLEEAERHLIDALSRYGSVGDRLGKANACLQLGQVALVQGRLGDAEGRLAEALAGYEEVGDRVGRANAGLQLGQIDLARHRYDSAESRSGDALTLYQLIGDRLGRANASLQLAQIDLARGRLEEAGRRLADARDGYRDIGDRLGQANSHHLIAVVAELGKGPAAAVAAFVEAAAVYASIGRHDSMGRNLAAAARCSEEQAERSGYAAQAMAAFQQAGLAPEVAKVAEEFGLEIPEESPADRVSPEEEPVSDSWPEPISAAMAAAVRAGVAENAAAEASPVAANADVGAADASPPAGVAAEEAGFADEPPDRPPEAVPPADGVAAAEPPATRDDATASTGAPDTGHARREGRRWRLRR